jgi:NAD(P)-dependent dehydrogenase (short-subunit alcohol dehydrogenase family)
MASNLKGKVALVTGGGSGIGRATAIAFAREGAKVAVADYVPGGGERTVKEIEAAGGEAIFIHADVSVGPQVEAMVRKIVQTWGRLVARTITQVSKAAWLTLPNARSKISIA